MNRTSVKLKFVVVGGGVSGLSAALALRLYGHEVVVVERFCEKDAFQKDSGGMRCPPNMTRLFKMDADSLKSLEHAGTQCEGLRFFDGKTGSLVGWLPFPPEMLHDLGSDFYMTQRSQYLKLTYKFCVGIGVKFVFGESVTAIDTSEPEQVKVDLGNGETVMADMVIGADGAGSIVRSIVVEDEEDEEEVVLMSGASVSIPVDLMRKDPELAPLCDLGSMNLWMGSNSSIIGAMHGKHHYDISFLSTHYHHGMHDTTRRTKFSVQDFVSFNIHDYDPRITKLVKLGTSCYFTTQRLLALESVVDETSRVVLMGDAARAPPIHGQHNSANALEDATTLSALLSYMRKREQLPRFMQAYEQIREPRSRDTQREQVHGHQYTALDHDGPERVARDASFRAMLEVMESGGEVDDEVLADTWADHLRQFDYDPAEAVNDWWLSWGRYMDEEE